MVHEDFWFTRQLFGIPEELPLLVGHKDTLQIPLFSIVTEQVARLLAAMGETPLAAREIMAKLGLTFYVLKDAGGLA